MKPTSKKIIAIGLASMAIGSVAVAAVNTDNTGNQQQMDEESLWEVEDQIYEQYADQYEPLEDTLDALFTQLYEAYGDEETEQKMLDEIDGVMGQLEALDEKTGLAGVYAQYEDFDDEIDPEVESAREQIYLDNKDAYDRLDAKMADLVADLIVLEMQEERGSDVGAEIERIDLQLEAIEMQYDILDEQTGMAALYEQFEEFDEEWGEEEYTWNEEREEILDELREELDEFEGEEKDALEKHFAQLSQIEDEDKFWKYLEKAEREVFGEDGFDGDDEFEDEESREEYDDFEDEGDSEDLEDEEGEK